MRKRDGYQFDDDEQVEDGRTVRTPMMLMDGRNGRVFLSDTVRFDENHQPHFVRAADETDARAAARDAREEMIDRATSAWRNPLDAHRKAAATAQKQANMRFSATAENADPSRISDARDARAVANASYDAMCARPGCLADAGSRFCSAGHGHPAGGSGVDAAASAHRAR